MIRYEEVIPLVKKTIEEIDDVLVLGVLMRKYKWRRNYMISNVLICLALHKLGIPINTSIFKRIRNISYGNANRILHHLGDRNILQLIRSKRIMHHYVLNPIFLIDIGWKKREGINSDELWKIE